MTLRIQLALAAVVTLTLLVLFAPPAAAQSGAAAAQKHVVSGEKAALKGDWTTALASFEAADQASPSANTAKRVAKALYELKRVMAAHDAYVKLLEDYDNSLFAQDKKVAAKRVEELAGKIGSLGIRVSETGATVSVDGKPVGTSPVTTAVRVLAGKHSIKVDKGGFAVFTKEVNVAGGATLTVDVSLQAESTAGKIAVAVEDGKALNVFIDGADVGAAPYEGALTPGEHTIEGRSDTLRAAAVRVTIKTGELEDVKLVATARGGNLEVRIDGGKGVISVDGEEVGAGGYEGELSAGEHTLKVTLDGHETFNKEVTITLGKVHVETVTLRKSAAGQVAEEDLADDAWRFDGLYGGLQLIGMFAPAGSGNTLDRSCDTTGASSCDGGTPLGGGIGGYIGYAFAPVGLELLVLGAGDVVQPLASFDGVTGTEINPLVAQPAREEEFVIGRFGGGGAFRLRLLWPIDMFRVTTAIGAGLAYRQLLLARDTVAASGAESSISDDGKGYLSGVLSFELAGQVLIGDTTALAVGFNLWLEHAGDDLKTQPDPDVLLLKDGDIPMPQATPAYDMASGTQVFLGPFVGMQFGP
jgi:hypothetical protein